MRQKATCVCRKLQSWRAAGAEDVEGAWGLPGGGFGLRGLLSISHKQAEIPVNPPRGPSGGAGPVLVPSSQRRKPRLSRPSGRPPTAAPCELCSLEQLSWADTRATPGSGRAGPIYLTHPSSGPSDPRGRGAGRGGADGPSKHCLLWGGPQRGEPRGGVGAGNAPTPRQNSNDRPWDPGLSAALHLVWLGTLRPGARSPGHTAE